MREPPLATAPDPTVAPPPSHDIFLRACLGERVERTPVWIMRQAGRYLPEYRALRERYDFLTTCRTPELACELTLQPLRRFPLDAAILFSDILIPLPGMGVSVAFEPGPRLERAVCSRRDVEALRVADARETAPFVADAVRLARRELQGRAPLIGFAGAPFTLASYLVEGGGSRTFERLKGLLFGEPATAHALLEKCARTVVSSLRQQVEAGAEAVMLFDTWASVLAPADYRAFALPYARRVFEAVAPAGMAPPRIYYAGNGGGWLDACSELGAEVIGLDWRTDLAAAHLRLGPGVVIQGNLDPCVLLSPLPEIRRRVRELLGSLRAAEVSAGVAAATGPAARHVFNLGHGILPSTPPEAVTALLDTVRESTVTRPP